MTTTAFVFGNGESRKYYKLDVEKFKKYGVTIGCNAIYRDFSPNILVATDCEMISEIVASGYPKKNKCYFRGWRPFEREIVQDLIADLTPNFNRVIDNSNGKPYIALMGHQDNIDRRESVGESRLFLVGTDPDDQIADLEEMGCDIIMGETEHPQTETYEFSGPVAVDLASKFAEIVYIFGFDMEGRQNGLINNIYKGTDNYYGKDSIENIKLPQSILELANVASRYPNTQYYRVGDPTRNPEIESNFTSNFKFIRYGDFVRQMKLDTLKSLQWGN